MKKSVRGNLKPDGYYEPQLVLCEMVLPSGGEWVPQLPGWVVIHVSSGVGYWRHFEQDLQPLRQALGDCLERF